MRKVGGRMRARLRRALPGYALAVMMTTGSGALAHQAAVEDAAHPGTSSPCADVALVLSIDASGSIDDREFLLQQNGYAAAFRDPLVQVALDAAGVVDVAAVIWGDSDFAPQIIPFHRIEGASDAARFGDRLGSIPRRTTGNTGLGSGLDHALNLLDDPSVCAARKIIDVSGDGRQVYFRGRLGMVTPVHARKRAEAMGVTINALAILSDEPELEAYFRKSVVTGAGAFVARAEGFHDFADILIEKLVRELVAGRPVCGRPDCG